MMDERSLNQVPLGPFPVHVPFISSVSTVHLVESRLERRATVELQIQLR